MKTSQIVIVAIALVGIVVLIILSFTLREKFSLTDCQDKCTSRLGTDDMSECPGICERARNCTQQCRDGENTEHLVRYNFHKLRNTGQLPPRPLNPDDCEDHCTTQAINNHNTPDQVIVQPQVYYTYYQRPWRRNYFWNFPPYWHRFRRKRGSRTRRNRGGS